jgi:hypothetical protein
MELLYQKSIKAQILADVFVAGGGPAGVACAVAAARQGAKVFLAESQGSFGGSGTVGLVPAFMPFGNGKDFLAGGVGREIYDELIGLGAPHEGMFSSVGIRAESLKLIYDQMIAKAGVDFLFFTTLIDTQVKDGVVQSAILSAKSGLIAVKAKVFVDCTGDGDLCAFSGADYEMGDDLGQTMPATLCSLWAGVDWAKVSGRDDRALEQAFMDKVFDAEDRHLPGMWKVSELLSGGNLGHCYNVDATNERSLTKAMVEGRKLAPQYQEYYSKYISGYEGIELVATGSYLGVRESRRIVCDYMLTGDDYMSRASFEDEIGRFSYPIDIHAMAPDKDSYEKFHKEHISLRYEDGESYGIPFRSLVPTKLANTLVAGRCAGADRQMQSSIRVMPACYIMGQAAGVAASMAASSGGDVRMPSIAELRGKLRDIGAFLPEQGLVKS